MDLLLIDLSGIVHAEYHLSGSDPNPDATSVKSLARVRALASGRSHVAICAEGKGSLRRDADPTYKANRPAQEAPLKHQMGLTLDALRADGFPVWSADGLEADDIIASACAHFADATITIVSADKDLEQLINDRVTIQKPDGRRCDASTVLATRGVDPHQMGDYLALVGDTSDNIKGAAGIGAKKAAAMLQKYGNLDDLYRALQQHGTQFSPATATSLREFEPRLPLVRSLITLRTDAPVPFDDLLTPSTPEVFSMTDELTDGITQDIAEAMPTRQAVMAAILPVDPMQRMAQEAQVVTQGAPPRAEAQAATPKPNAPQEPPDGSQGLVVAFEQQLEPNNMKQAFWLAQQMFASRLFSAYGNPAGVLSTILAGRELGLQAMASLRAFHVIDGTPTMSADLIRSLVLKSPVCEYFRCTERSDTAAAFVTKRKGDPELVLRYTLEEAKTAGLVKTGSGWTKNPSDMLVARASSKLCRLVYADIVFNCYAPEEF